MAISSPLKAQLTCRKTLLIRIGRKSRRAEPGCPVSPFTDARHPLFRIGLERKQLAQLFLTGLPAVLAQFECFGVMDVFGFFGAVPACKLGPESICGAGKAAVEVGADRALSLCL